jgi:hypothetical protein
MTLNPPDVPYLKHLLLGLPKELPLGTARKFPFSNYVLQKHDEGVGAAISKSVKDAFGWDAPTQLAIMLTMTAHGEHVAAVADVLHKWMKPKSRALLLNPIVSPTQRPEMHRQGYLISMLLRRP